MYRKYFHLKNGVIVIVVKYFIRSENCPLFPDGVAGGEMPFGNYSAEIATEFAAGKVDALRDVYLAPANATRLLKHDVYTDGEIAEDCTYNGHLPEPYCKLQPQEREF